MAIFNSINLLKDDGPGQVIWAITNVCNAKCAFCSYTTGKGGAPHHVDFPTAQKVLDILEERNWRIISFTGGEPLLNPDVYKIITYAVKKGFITRTGTNGRILSKETAKKLKATGIRNLWISLDSESEEKHEANRGMPGLIRHLKEVIPYLKEEGVKVNAAVPVNKLIGNYRRFFDFLLEMGLDTVAFCYPMTTMAASYGGAAENVLVEFTPEELVQVLEEIRHLKQSRYKNIRVINPEAGLKEIINMQQGKPSRFPCLGGYKFFYLDWHLTLYRCAFLAENYGNILELAPDYQFSPAYCDKCMWQCFRDPAIYYYFLQSLKNIKRNLIQGNFYEAVNIWRETSTRKSAQAWIDLIRDRFYL